MNKCFFIIDWVVSSKVRSIRIFFISKSFSVWRNICLFSYIKIHFSHICNLNIQRHPWCKSCLISNGKVVRKKLKKGLKCTIAGCSAWALRLMLKQLKHSFKQSKVYQALLWKFWVLTSSFGILIVGFFYFLTLYLVASIVGNICYLDFI